MADPSVIAIDGPAGSGKTSVGRSLARRLGFRFLDTGLMYRAATLLALRKGIPLDDEAALGEMAEGLQIEVVGAGRNGQERILVNGEDVTGRLRDAAVEDAVSLVSRVSAVRHALVEQQRRLAREGRIVMAGRDIGTRVLPHAFKVYLDASTCERARRRYREALERGTATTLEAVRANLELRDRLDSERVESPLRVAEDAVRIDTEGLEVEQVVDRIVHAMGVVGA